jgi:hypothetical protein
MKARRFCTNSSRCYLSRASSAKRREYYRIIDSFDQQEARRVLRAVGRSVLFFDLERMPNKTFAQWHHHIVVTETE